MQSNNYCAEPSSTTTQSNSIRSKWCHHQSSDQNTIAEKRAHKHTHGTSISVSGLGRMWSEMRLLHKFTVVAATAAAAACSPPRADQPSSYHWK